MQIGVPTEILAGERRVAATPETVKKLIGQGHQVRVQRGAGVHASVTDEAYAAVGAELTDAIDARVDHLFATGVFGMVRRRTLIGRCGLPVARQQGAIGVCDQRHHAAIGPVTNDAAGLVAVDVVKAMVVVIDGIGLGQIPSAQKCRCR